MSPAFLDDAASAAINAFERDSFRIRITLSLSTWYD
jgi:hypothetical protein